MPKSKRNNTLFEELLDKRRTALIYSCEYELDGAHPVHKAIHQMAKYPDAERIKSELAGQIAGRSANSWKDALAPDQDGKAPNLLVVEYNWGQHAGGATEAFWFPISKQQTPLTLDWYDRRWQRMGRADGVGSFCMEPLATFYKLHSEHFDAFGDTDHFHPLNRLSLASSHILAHQAFVYLEEQGELKKWGNRGPVYIATKEHGESYLDVIYVLGG